MIRRIAIMLQRAPYTVAFGAIFGGMLAYAWFKPPFLYYQNLPFPPVVQIIRAGNLIPLSVERCSTSDKLETYKTTRRLVHFPKADEARLPDIILESRDVDILPGCHREISKLNAAPPDTPAGTWMATGTALVPSLLRVHKVLWYSETFEVTR